MRRTVKHMKYSLILLALFIGSCSTSPYQKKVEDLVSPTNAKSGEPAFFNLANSEVGLSWIESEGETNSVKFSIYKNSTWTAPHTMVSDTNVLANWADFPGIVTNGANWVAWYLQMTNPKTFAYDVMVMQSFDDGTSWTTPQKLHNDSTQTEHGFVSAVPATGGFQLIWLDGRLATDMSGNYSLRTAFLDFEGVISNRAILDDNTCTCCQTSFVNVGNDFMALYRDRSEEEIRDIRTVKFNNLDSGHHSQVLNNDNWHIAGCPVNGPRAINNKEEIGVVWFTMGTDAVAKVQFAHSSNGGESYSAPLLVDADNLGRVDILAKGDSYFVSYLDESEEGNEIQVAEIQDGIIVTTHMIATVSNARKTGFPRMALAKHGEGIYITYTNVETDNVEIKFLSF